MNVDAQLPVVVVRVGGKMVRGLVDTGCSVTMMEQRLVRPDQIQSVSEKLQTVLGQAVVTHGAWVEIEVSGKLLKCWVLLAKSLQSIGVEMILGMDTIASMGGVNVGATGGGIRFGAGTVNGPQQAQRESGGSHRAPPAAAAAAPVSDSLDQPGIQTSALKGAAPTCIVDQDFTAVFDGSSWSVRWQWKDGRAPPVRNSVSEYESARAHELEVDAELEDWKAKGWMVECERHRQPTLPLMAVFQEAKAKVRPVLDYRELN